MLKDKEVGGVCVSALALKGENLLSNFIIQYIAFAESLCTLGKIAQVLHDLA